MYDSDNESLSSYTSTINHSKYILGMCDLYHPVLHGDIIDGKEEILSRFLYMTDTDLESSEQMISLRMSNLRAITNNNGGVNCLNHPIVRNYQKLTYHNYHMAPQIIEICDGPYDYTTAIIKTHFIRLLQRKWKKICAERKRVIALRKHPKSIQYRTIHGRWPANCSKYV